MQDPFFNTKFKKNSNFLLSVSDMYRIDKKAIEDGRSSLKLMSNAGKKVAEHSEKILKKYGFKNVLILCGPGNNGGMVILQAIFSNKTPFQLMYFLQ